MKGLITQTLIVTLFSFLLVSVGYAKEEKMMPKHGKWMCETNSSQSSSSAPKAMPGKDAFLMAMKNCGDCTKITCTMESQ